MIKENAALERLALCVHSDRGHTMRAIDAPPEMVATCTAPDGITRIVGNADVCLLCNYYQPSPEKLARLRADGHVI